MTKHHNASNQTRRTAKLDLAIGGNKHVLRFEVTVNDAGRVNVLQCAEHLLADELNVVRRQLLMMVNDGIQILLH